MYKIRPAILYTSELNKIFLESFYNPQDKFYHCSYWTDYEWIPSKDNSYLKEYVVIDDYNNPIVFFSWEYSIGAKKVYNGKLLKINELCRIV